MDSHMIDPTQEPRLPNSPAYDLFCYAQFALAAFMMGAGIFNLQASLTAKGYYAMASIMLVSATIAITKALRDREERKRLHFVIEEARTNRLLRETAD